MDANDTYTVVLLVFWGFQILLNGLIPCVYNSDFKTLDMYADNKKADWQPASFTFAIWMVIYTTGTVLFVLMLTGTVEPFVYESTYFMLIFSTVLNVLWVLLWVTRKTVWASVDLLLLAAILISVFISEFSGGEVYAVNVLGIYALWAVAASLLNLQTVVGNGPVIETICLSFIVVVQVALVSVVAAYYSSYDNALKILGVILTGMWASFGVLYAHQTVLIVAYFVLNSLVALGFFIWLGVAF